MSETAQQAASTLGSIVLTLVVLEAIERVRPVARTRSLFARKSR